MNKNKEKVPKIRFPGFTEPWEQRKLGELSNSFEYGLNAAATEFDGKNKYIRITDINDESRDFMDDDLTSPDIDLSNADKYKLSRGDILFARTGASVGKTYIYKECDGLVYYAGFLIRAKIREEYNPGFIFQNTLTKDYEKYISITSQRSGQPGVNAQEYSEYKIMVPNRAEQDKISAYFRSIDNLITLHQRKLNHLKDKKKGLLQKMFPKKGELVPELRFPEFTDPWEQRKLGDVFAQKVNYVDPIKEMIELWSLTVEKGLTPKTERYNREALVKKNDKFKVVHPGDIVYNPMNMTIGAVGFNNSSKSVAVSGYYVTMNMKTGFDNKFFNTWLPSPNALNLYKNYATGSLIEKQRVQFPTLSGIKLDIPKLEEQIKIGSFFAKIDNLITLHQRKLDHLKEQKKALLQQMFI
ncbi:restriction endonuclease subunit S [Clostridium butyricum]|uniref:EcoKI restriction-modification system protein HsdS n=1 Tax=Clostridium butyricum TaxID=1492 RepID=A0A6N3H6T8_CLOBU